MKKSLPALFLLFILMACTPAVGKSSAPTAAPYTVTNQAGNSSTSPGNSSEPTAATPVNVGDAPILLSEDFEGDQVMGWNFKAADWQIVTDDTTGSQVWTSAVSEVAYASNGSAAWRDYTFQVQARRTGSTINLYFRIMGDKSYALRLEDDRLVLWTERSGSQEELASADFAIGSIWHDYQITVIGAKITVSVDKKGAISFSDGSDAMLTGGIALEIISKAGGRFDNVQVTGIVGEQTIGIETVDQWVQTNGPQGGVINSIEIDPANPDVLYAGGVGGMFKSTDAGTNWRSMTNFSASYGTVLNILIDRDSPNVLYVDTGKLYKTSDAGERWALLFNGAPVSCVVMDPGNPSRLMFGNNGGQVWMTLDGGYTWHNASSNLPNYNIIAVAFGTGQELWAGSGLAGGTESGYLYHSLNNGGSWSPVDLGQAETSQIQSIFVDPLNKETIYIGLRNRSNEMFDRLSDIYLVKTVNDGKHWQTLRLPSADAMINVMGFNSDHSVLFTGDGGYLYASEDEGQTWKTITPPSRNGDFYDIASDPRNPLILYLPLKAHGIVKSVDGGSNWSPINEGLLNTIVSLIALGNSSGSTIYAASVNGEGTYRSTDYGNTWVNVTAGGIGHPWADELTVSPADPKTIWEVADVGQTFVSNDGGGTWRMTIDTYRSGFRAGTITAAAIAPSDANVIYVLKSGFGIFKSMDGGKSWDFLHQSEVDYTYSLVVNPTNYNNVFSGDMPKPFQQRARVQRTLDGGQTWSTVLTVPNSSGITSVAMDPQHPQTVYAASTGRSENGGGQIYRSLDNGNSWSQLNPHFTMLTVWGQPQLIGDPNNSSIVYAATWLAGTWKTTDAGRSWTKLENAPISSTALSIDPKDSQILYAADRTAPRLWKSTDGGSNWAIRASFASSGAFLVNRVLASGSSVYISTFGPTLHSGKLYRSIDGGLTWVDITNGLPRSVLDIAVDPSQPDTLYVTTHIFGAYKSTDGGTTWAEMKNFPDIGAYDIEIDQTSPNILYVAGLGGSVPDWVLEGGHTFQDAAGVYKSTDGGQTWTQILVTSNECRAVRIYPTNHNLLFVSSLSDGFFVSTDGGSNWKNYNNGLESTNLTSLWVNGEKVYVGTQGFGVYSGDVNAATGAVTWVADRSNKPVPDVYNLQIQVDPTDSNKIYVGSNPGGLYRSDDGGMTWCDKNFLTPSVTVDDPLRQGYYTFAINPDNTNEVWVATWGKGIYKSYDGQDYNIGANGLDRVMFGKHVNTLLFHPDLGLIAATEEGIFLTQDGGATWTDWSQGLGTKQVRTLNLLGNGPILAGTAGYELYIHSAAGVQWNQARALGNFGTFWPIWNNRPLYQYSQLLFDPTNPNTIYFGTFPVGIFKSTDGGATWNEYNVGWTFDGVFTLVFQPGDASIIYSGTYNGINRSLDAGGHWETWSTGWPSQQWVFSIAFDPTDPNVMYACSKNGENEGTGRAGFHGTVMKSTDGGATWFAITSGLDLNNEFYKIIVDRFDANTIYLATQYAGVYVSRNAGTNWQPFNEGLTNLQAGTNGNNVTNTMALSEDGSVLYFGSAGSGIFRRTLTSH
jgi:photosystem II stability/assembly factor-like uncharacterized protein